MRLEAKAIKDIITSKFNIVWELKFSVEYFNALVSLLYGSVFTVLINRHSYEGEEGDTLNLNYTFQTTSKYTSCKLETRAQVKIFTIILLCLH